MLPQHVFPLHIVMTLHFTNPISLAPLLSTMKILFLQVFGFIAPCCCCKSVQVWVASPKNASSNFCVGLFKGVEWNKNTIWHYHFYYPRICVILFPLFFLRWHWNYYCQDKRCNNKIEIEDATDKWFLFILSPPIIIIIIIVIAL